MSKYSGLITTLRNVSMVGKVTELVIRTEMHTGIKGERGFSTYEEWLLNGHTGTYDDFLNYIVGAPASISTDADNRLTRGTDGGLFVLDNLSPDPLVSYILAKG